MSTVSTLSRIILYNKQNKTTTEIVDSNSESNVSKKFFLPDESGKLLTEEKTSLIYLTKAIAESIYRKIEDSYSKAETDNKLSEKLAVSTYNTDKQTFATKTDLSNGLNAKANANAVVNLNGDQTIPGNKTFSSPLGVANGTANNHAVNKGQMDAGLNAKANANAVVNRTGNQDIDGNKNFRGQLSRQTDPGASDNSAQVATTRWINNFFNNKKAQIANWGMPDYSSTISGVGNNYRAPRDGYFVFSMTYGDGTKDITINGVAFGNVIPSSGGYGSGGLFVPLAKNDVINIGSNAVLNYSYFIPCKGAN